MTHVERVPGTRPQRRRVEAQDWERAQRLYIFCRARAIDRLALAEQQHPESTTKQRRDLRVLEAIHGKARQHDDIVTSCAITYFRAQAMKDAQHPDFLGEWIRPRHATDGDAQKE